MLDFLSNSCLSLSYFICINRVNVTACQENAGVLFYAAQFIALGTLGLAFLGSRTATIQLLEIAKALQLRVLERSGCIDRHSANYYPGIPAQAR
jgi:hypothetical protein